MITIDLNLWCMSDGCGVSAPLRVRLLDSFGDLDLTGVTPSEGPWSKESMTVPSGWKIVDATGLVKLYALCPAHSS
jgi:hypothetical protein